MLYSLIDMSIQTLTESLKHSWSGEGKDKLNESMSKASNNGWISLVSLFLVSTSITLNPFLQSDTNAELALNSMDNVISLFIV